MNLNRIFEDTPAERRRLVLLLYAIVGPVFTSVLLLVRDPARSPWLVAGVVGLILIGGAAILRARSPTTRDWILPVAIAPTVCCGLAFVACGPLGAAYLGVMGAPLAWAAILFGRPVVVSAFVTATLTCFAALLSKEGVLAAAASTLCFSTINGLVAWVVAGLTQNLRETRRQLLASGERDRALLQAIPDVLVRADREGRFIDVHAPPGAALPLGREALVGRSVFELIPPDVAPRMRAAIDRAFHSESAQVVHYAVPYGAEVRHFEARLAHVSADEVLVVRRDVTELDKAREALVESEARFRTLVSGAPVGIFQSDVHGSCLYVNQAWQRLTGLSAEEASGEGWLLSVPPEARATAAVQWREAVEAGVPFRRTMEYQTSAGLPVWLEVWVTPQRDSHGTITGFIGGAVDVTDRVRADRALRESEERLQLAMGAGAHVAWDWDVEHDVFTNGSDWEPMIGRARGEVVDSIDGWRSLVHPDDLGRAWKALEDCVEGRAEEYRADYRVRHSSGAWRWVRSRGRAAARAPDGRAIRVAGTRTDITELQELQEKLLAATRLASVGSLAAGVAHEINNPLAWITSNISYAVERLKAGVEPGREAGGQVLETCKVLDEALEGAWRIAAIVKAMRSLGRPQDGDVPQEVDVRSELLSALQMVRNQIEQRATLVVDIPRELPLARAKTSELGRVFLNLLVNAAQAIPEGDSGGHRIEVAARANGSEVVVEVADSGCGITKEVQDRLFDPFFTTRPVGQGTGLGLTIARAIVDSAGGRIEVEGAERRGARFRVRLPVMGAERSRAPRPSSETRPPARRRRVLIIDDEPMVRRAFELLLAGRHDVTSLASAADALKRLEAGQRWDAILCDLMMPGMDGVAFYESLSERFPGDLPRLAFVTGGAFGDRAKSFLASHEVLVVLKPMDAGTLLGVVERLATAGAVKAEPAGSATAGRGPPAGASQEGLHLEVTPSGEEA